MRILFYVLLLRQLLECSKNSISNNGVDFEYSGSTFTFGNLPNITSFEIGLNVSVYGTTRYKCSRTQFSK